MSIHRAIGFVIICTQYIITNEPIGPGARSVCLIAQREHIQARRHDAEDIVGVDGQCNVDTVIRHLLVGKVRYD